MQVETIVVGAFDVNCYIAWVEPTQAIVIDPGDDPDRILDVMQKKDLRPALYLLTHGHTDHICAVKRLCDLLPAPVAMHPEDELWAFEPPNRMPPFYGTPERPDEIARALEDGQTWTDGQMEYEILGTPGHSPGSVCLLFRKERALFSGDTLFAGSIGRTDLALGDGDEIMVSLARLAKLDDDIRVYPGHGEPSTMGIEKQTNTFLTSLPADAP